MTHLIISGSTKSSTRQAISNRWINTFLVNLKARDVIELTLQNLNIGDQLHLSNFSTAFPAIETLRTWNVRMHTVAGTPPSTLQYVDMQNAGIARVCNGTWQHLTILQSLNLAGNSLTALHSGMFLGATMLNNIDLSNNAIARVPTGAFQHVCSDALANCFINLGGNHLNEIDADAFPPNVRVLNLTQNRLHTVRRSWLRGLENLYSISLSRNRITAVEEHAFADMSPANASVRLAINLANNRLRQLPRYLFSTTATLSTFDLSDNEFGSVPACFKEMSRQGGRVVLHTNKIQSLLASDFHQDAQFDNLDLGSNRLADLSTASIPVVRGKLDLGFNLLRHFSTALFKTTTAWPTRLSLEENPELGTNQPLFYQELGKIQYLNLAHTGLRHLHSLESTSITGLDLSSNSLRAMPALAGLPRLRTLSLQGHRIQQLNLESLSSLPDLVKLDISSRGGSDVVGPLPTSPLPKLRSLRAKGVDISVKQLKQLARPESLTELVFGLKPRSNRNSGSFDMSAVCNLLASDVQQLEIWHLPVADVELCANTRFNTLAFRASSQLTAITTRGSSINFLDVKDSEHLRDIRFDATTANIPHIDVSGTAFNGWESACEQLGTQSFVAKRVSSTATLNDRPFLLSRMLDRCLESTYLFDLSGTKLSNVAAFESSLRRFTLPISQHVVMDNMLFVCDRRFNATGLDASGAEWGFSISSCDCIEGYERIGASDHCTKRRRPHSPMEILVGITLPALAVVTVIAGLAWWRIRRDKGIVTSLEEDRDLHVRLVQEKDEEVLQLRRVWEVREDELELIKCVSVNSASGDVWKARWDTQVVAVKMLKSDRFFFEQGLEDFEKEVDFLQRMRHPNLVRFFGAGQKVADNTPFIVLEFVELGSLRSLLAHEDIAAYLQQRVGSTRGNRASVSSLSSALEETVVPRPSSLQASLAGQTTASTTGTTTTATTATGTAKAASFRGSKAANGSLKRARIDDADHDIEVFDVITSQAQRLEADAFHLKLALLGDIARGMEFIHSEGHVHR